MKKVLIGTAATLLILITALLITNLFVMKSLRTEITIDASPEKVWNVLMDHPQYATWNPFITQVSGNAQEGQHLEVTISPDGQKPMKFTPEVLVNKDQLEFRWLGKLFVKGLADGEHYFQLEQTEDGKTRFVHGEHFTGLLAGVLVSIMGENTLKGFNDMNVALKAMAEKA